MMTAQRTMWTVLFTVALLLAGPALAGTDYTYSGPATGAWKDAGNWTTGGTGYPDADGDIANITGGETVNYDGGGLQILGTDLSNGTVNQYGYLKFGWDSADTDKANYGLVVGSSTTSGTYNLVGNDSGSNWGQIKGQPVTTDTAGVDLITIHNGSMTMQNDTRIYEATGAGFDMQMNGGTFNMASTNYIRLGGTMYAEGNAVANFSGNNTTAGGSSFDEMRFSQNATLNLSDGILRMVDYAFLARDLNTDPGSGTSTITGGTLQIDNHGLYVGKSYDNGGTGFNANSDHTLEVSGGTIDIQGAITGDMGIGLFSYATLSIQGDDATINVGRNFDLGTGGTLEAIIDADGISKLNMGKDIEFWAGSELDVALASGYTPTGPMTWVLAEWVGEVQNSSAGNLAFASGVDTSLWSFNVDEVNNQLTVSYVPEPTTLALLGMGGLAILRRRRR